MANSIRATRLQKPRPDFPLFPHRNGWWAKKIRGSLRYFGKVADDPKGENAIQAWAEQKDDLLAGRTPWTSSDGLTVRDLVNHFLTAKEQQRAAGDIRSRTFDEYYTTCEAIVEAFGKRRLAADLAADDFQALRANLAKRYGVHRLAKEIQLTRTLFKYGYDAGLIDQPVRFGPVFKKPAARLMRAHRQQNGERMFEAEQLRTIIDAADQPLKAMILLGINCGFRNTDCGTLPQAAMDLNAGWANYPRPKTAVERRCPLWPETVAAIQEAIERRPKPKQKEHDGLAFHTKYGQPWAKDTPDNPVTKEFRKLLDKIDTAAAVAAKKRKAKPPKKLYRRGLGFYALRHTFETIAGESRDQVAVNAIMGHVDSSMAAQYGERISDDRLTAVTDRVLEWLFPGRTEK